MDYHRYGSIGVGSVPPLLTGPSALGGNGLADHPGPPGTGPPPPPIPGAPSSLLNPHHSSLMFHYGVGGKPHSVPPHLLPSVSVVSPVGSNIGSTSCNTSNINKNGGSGATLLTGKASGSGVNRTTATVPPLGLPTSMPSHTTTAGSARSTSPNSSFAAALRSLAKQATGPTGSDAESSVGDPNPRTPPKTMSLPSTSAGPSVSMASAPPVVTVAPTHAHLTLPEMRKSSVEGYPEMERSVVPEDIVRGFQPYRAPELPSVSAPSAVSQAQLRPTLPLDLTHAYPPYPSLYSHHLSHQYRLEEQLYLERYGLLRPPLSPYGVGGLSALYPTASPYLTRFPPELLPTSLAALHPSSALLHERLKLEEDIRQREYERELRRERELERERERGREREREREREKEKEREREREKEKEREKRQKEFQENEKLKEERLKNIESARENTRDRSPLSHAASALWNSSSNSSSTIAPSFMNKGLTQGISSQIGVRPPDSSRMPQSSMEVAHSNSSQLLSSRDSSVIKFDSSASRSNGGLKHRTPAIVRPFETPSTSATVTPSTGFLVAATSLPPATPEERETNEKKSETKFVVCEKIATSSEEIVPISSSQSDVCKPFTVWQPVQLNSSSTSHERVSSVHTQPIHSSLIISSAPVPYREGCLPPSTSPHGASDVTYSKNYAVPSVISNIGTPLQSTSVCSKSGHSSHATPVTSSPIPHPHNPPLFLDGASPYLPVPHVTQAAAAAPNLVSVQTSTSLSTNLAHIHPSHEWRSFLSAPQNAPPSSSSVTTSSSTIEVSTTTTILPTPSATDVGASPLIPNLLHPIGDSLPSVFPKSPHPPPCLPTSIEKPLPHPPQQSPTPHPDVSFTPEQSKTPGVEDAPLQSSQKPLTPISRLDTEEQRLRELRAMGMLAAEAEETLLEEALTPTKTPGVLCMKGPPNPLEASTEKLSFLCSFGLTTHDKADEVELGRYERRAKVLTPLSSSPRKDPTSPNGCVSAGKLAPMLAPGQSLPESYKVKNSSLLVDFSNKSRFLHHLDLQPQHSISKQKEVERIWKVILEERLRRYRQDDNDDPLTYKICSALKLLLEDKAPSSPSSPPESTALQKEVENVVQVLQSVCPVTSSATSTLECKAFPPSSCIQTVAPTTSLSHSVGALLLVQQLQNATTSSSVWGFPISNTSVTSSAQVRPSLLKVGMKGLFDDGLLGIENYLPTEHDPMASLSGFEKMIDHIVKNAQAEDGGENSRLLEHIEEVRRCQLSVCQSAQIVQDQITKLISSRSQLEAHRAALHHHLASITNILASKNHQQNASGGVPSTTTAASSEGINSSQISTTVALPSKAVANHSSASSNYAVSLSFHPHLYSMSTVQSSHQSGTSGTNIYSAVTQPPFSSVSHGTPSSASSTMPIPALVPLTTKGTQSSLPTTTVVSWAGVSPPFLPGTNIPISLEGKDAIFYPNLVSRDFKTPNSQGGTTQIQLKLNPKVSTLNMSTSAGNVTKSSSNTSSRSSGSTKGVTGKPHNTYIQGQLTNKFNGSTASLSQRNLFKPLQQSGTSSSSNFSSKSGTNLNIITCNTFPSGVGTFGVPISSQSQQLNLIPAGTTGTPSSSPAFLSPKGASPLYANHSSASKSHKNSKSPIGFAPYTKSSPNKLQTWFPN